MSRITPITLGLALPLSLLSQAAFADLTPAQVWGDWRSYLEGMGYEVAATETTNGGDLTVSDIDMSFATAQVSGGMSVALGTVTFTQNNDGTVAVIFPNQVPISLVGVEGGEDGAKVNMAMNIAQTGHSMIVSGSQEAMRYLYNAETLALTVDQTQASDGGLGDPGAHMDIAATEVQSNTLVTTDTLRSYEQTSTIGNVTYDIFVQAPDAPDMQTTMKGTIGGINATGNGTIPMAMTQGGDVAAMMADGLEMAATFSYANGTSATDINDPENGNYMMRTSSNGGDFTVGMSTAGLLYDIAQRDLNVNVTAATLPFPVELNMAQSGFKLAMPVMKSDDPQDFAFGITLADFTMSDLIWSIFDPTAQLPRDPATIMLDLTGKAKLLINWMDPAAAAQMEGQPGEVKELTLGGLLVNAAGAKLEGGGAIAFDGAAGGLVPGMGNPVGDVNLALAGGNGLIDKLVGMGLLPQEQAMGARMMMGLFAVAGDAPDTLKSKIEFTSEGQVLANGQRIR